MLIDDVEQLIAERQLDRGTENQYRRAAKDFSEWLGRPAQRTDLEERKVNEWLRSLEPCKAPPTVLGRKRGITAIWNWLSERQLAGPYSTNRLRRIKVALPPPTAWSIPNVEALLLGAKDLTGILSCGVRAADLMRAWVLVAYETGLRPKDLRLLTTANLNGNRLYVSQSKTGKPHHCTLTTHAISALETIRRENVRELFGVPKSTIRRYELRLFQAAEKYGFVRRRGQSIGTLRKTHGTEVCRLQGLEAAARSLGHVSGTTIAAKHYVQPDAISSPSPPPPIKHADISRTQGTREDHSDPPGRAEPSA